MKRLTFLFSMFILLIIVLADVGVLSRYLGFLYTVPIADKPGHFLLYGILALLLNLVLFRSFPGQRRSLLAVKSGVVLVPPIGLEELSQQYFSNRTFDLVDLTFCYLGVVFFSWVALKM